MKILAIENYQRIAGCIAFAFLITGIKLLHTVTMIVMTAEDIKFNGLSITWSVMLACGIILVGIKILRGSTKMYHWAIVLSAIKFLNVLASATLFNVLSENGQDISYTIFKELDDLVIWALALYASFWLWKNRSNIEAHNL